MALTADHRKRYRGLILSLLDINHSTQKARLDHLTLGISMRNLNCGVGEYDVLTLLQDLCDRSLIKYTETRNKLTNDTSISKIEITPAGRDILEGTTTDKAIEV